MRMVEILARAGFRPVSGGAIRLDAHVLARIGAVGERPEDRVGARRIDVLAHRDADLAAVGAQRGGGLQAAPDFGARGAARELQEDHLTQIGEGLVHLEPLETADADCRAQMREEHRLKRDLLHHARFARRHLTDDGDEDGAALVRDRGHLHRHVEVFQRDVAVAFAERAFRFEQFAIDQAFDDDFGVGGHVQVDARRLDDADGRAGKPTGDRHLVLVDRQFLRPGEQHHRGATDDNGAGHRLFALLVFLPMHIAAGAARARRHAHAETVLCFQRAAIGAHVLHAGFRVAGDAERGGQIGRGIEAGRRDRHRQSGETAAGALEVGAFDNDLLAGAGGHDLRRDRLGDRVIPRLADLVDRTAHADGVDLGRGGERADRDRNVVAAARAVDYVGKKKSATLVFGEAALELPAHQRVQLAVLVDRAVDAGDEAALFEPAQMLLEIARRPVGRTAILLLFPWSIEHAPLPLRSRADYTRPLPAATEKATACG